MPLIAAIMALFMGWYVGYVAAHKEVATECERLGAFYVGDETYKCNRTDNQ